jgi:rhodanese-related sulfurtransferase
MPYTLDRAQLQTRLGATPQPVLVEALPRKYFDDWHLPGARHMPHDQVRTLASTVLPERDAEIVVYCASSTCQNSHIAARVLEQMGYTHVSVYAGGKQDWSEAGLPVERGVVAQAA